MYTIINARTNRELLKIKIESFKDFQVFIWKMFELYSVNVVIIGMTKNTLEIELQCAYTNNIITDIDIQQTDYNSLEYPL